MPVRKLHWFLPYAGQTLCGQPTVLASAALGSTLSLARRLEDVTCLTCQRTLAEPWHGTSGGYTNHKCRCTRCRAANNAKQRDWRDRHRGMEPPRHGTENAYTNYGCHCWPCREAHNGRPGKAA